MGTKVNNFQNNAKNSNIILTQKSSETETNGSVTIFKNSEFGDIRTIVDPNGDVWFVAIDVARSLGYATPKNPIKRHVDEEDTILLQLSDFQRGSFWAPLEINELDSIRVINESGLYSLVLSSKLESAKKFKRWVTSEVLPSIRKTGSYSITPKLKIQNRALDRLFIFLWRSGSFPVLHIFCYDSRRLYHRVKIVFKII